jgi:hypothetical protein
LVLFFERLPLPLFWRKCQGGVFLMVQATQIMHLFGQRDRFMPS